jgi:serine/threonine protein kinase/Tol biopolymer transport system component
MGDPRNRLSDLYHQALERAPEERRAFLREACDGDDLLLAEVESLLRHAEGSGGFLDRAVAAVVGRSLVPTAARQAMVNRQLGSYRLLALLGAGGMGEVYRARDTKLGREVAIKILPPHVTADPERRARLAREARVLATLNHPHIGAIYGLEESDGSTALVLELVEGETLAERLTRGPLPVAQTLAITRQIADALHAAHEKGIVHRDLKPANIILQRGSGSHPDDVGVKVLDFGLAKSTPGPDFLPSEPPAGAFASTADGRILGTPAYMSPEQARGQPVDERTDIWSFGCVLFEMLTGAPAFSGETTTDIVAAVLNREPDWTLLPSEVPATVRRIARSCLEKDRNRRGPVRFLLAATMSDEEPGTSQVPRSHMRRVPRTITWGLAGAVAIVAVPLLPLWSPRDVPPASAPVRLRAELGTDASLVSDGPAVPSVALSRSGEVLAFAARHTVNGSPQLYVRRLDEVEATPLASTDGARHPFFSPDGQWIGFFADGKLKKVPVAGGAAVTLADARDDRGGSWWDDGTIVFTPDARPGFGLWHVSATGGPAKPLTTLDGDEVTHRWPQVLPAARGVVFTAHNDVLGFGDATLAVLPMSGGAHRVVHRGGSSPRYLTSGHLVFARDETLFALPFSLDRLDVVGDEVAVVEALVVNPLTGASELAVSDAGTLAYVPANRREVPIYWMARDGKPEMLRATPANWNSARFSPDGTRIALQIGDGLRSGIWVYDWSRDVLSRVTSSSANPLGDGGPVWTNDGRRIVFSSAGRDGGPMSLHWQAADGSGEAEPLTQSKNRQVAGSWHPNGTLLAFTETTERAESDLLILPLEGDDETGWTPGAPTVFLQTPFWERAPMFSPDGRWIAYLSDESGRWEVYVRPFPGPGAKTQISAGGADTLAWSSRDPAIFYGTDDGTIMTVRYRVEHGSFHAATPQPWSVTRVSPRPRLAPLAIHPDGERFAVAPADVANPAPLGSMRFAGQRTIMFVFGFFDELRRVAPRNR